MKKLIKRLLGKKGESLVESIASILIFTLTSIALFSMLMASARINQETKAANEDYTTQMKIAETGDGDNYRSGVLRVSVSYNNGAAKTTIGNFYGSYNYKPYDVLIYQEDGNDNALYSYLIEEGGT